MTQEFLKIFFFFCLIFPDLNLIVVEEFLLWYGTAPNEPKTIIIKAIKISSTPLFECTNYVFKVGRLLFFILIFLF